MSLFQLILTLVTVVCLAAGQILFKVAAHDLDFAGRGIVENLLNLKLISALSVYAFATILWLVVLKMTPLRLAYPFVALAFVIVPIAATCFWVSRSNGTRLPGLRLSCWASLFLPRLEQGAGKRTSPP